MGFSLHIWFILLFSFQPALCFSGELYILKLDRLYIDLEFNRPSQFCNSDSPHFVLRIRTKLPLDVCIFQEGPVCKFQPNVCFFFILVKTSNTGHKYIINSA